MRLFIRLALLAAVLSFVPKAVTLFQKYQTEAQQKATLAQMDRANDQLIKNLAAAGKFAQEHAAPTAEKLAEEAKALKAKNAGNTTSPK